MSGKAEIKTPLLLKGNQIYLYATVTNTTGSKRKPRNLMDIFYNRNLGKIIKGQFKEAGFEL